MTAIAQVYVSKPLSVIHIKSNQLVQQIYIQYYQKIQHACTTNTGNYA